MENKQEKLMGEAYDKLYDLNTAFSYKFKHLLEELEKEANAQGYEFKLSACDKWKLKRINGE